MRKLLGASRMVGMAIWLVLIGVPCIAMRILLTPTPLAFRIRTGSFWTWLWGWGTTRILGVRVRVTGPLPPKGSFVVANHVSWMDIPLLGGAYLGSFIAKAEISGWPLFGWIAQASGTLFVNRSRSRDTHRLREELHHLLDRGVRIMMFAEGGAGSGETIRPFRPPLLAAPASLEVPCVPAVFRYSSRDAWWPETTSLNWHVFEIACRTDIECEIRHGDPVHGLTDRKDLAAELQKKCEALYEAPRT